MLFKVFFRLVTGDQVSHGNYAAYRGVVAREVLLHPYFDLCYSSTSISLSLPIRFVPCERGVRYAGRSRVDSQLCMHGIRMLMPFVDRIAIRALIALSITFGAGVLASVVVLGLKLFSTAAIPGWATSTMLLVVIMSLIALGNFVVLFALFSHSRGLSLAGLELVTDRNPPPPDGRARKSPQPTD